MQRIEAFYSKLLNGTAIYSEFSFERIKRSLDLQKLDCDLNTAKRMRNLLREGLKIYDIPVTHKVVYRQKGMSYLAMAPIPQTAEVEWWISKSLYDEMRELGLEIEYKDQMSALANLLAITTLLIHTLESRLRFLTSQVDFE